MTIKMVLTSPEHGSTSRLNSPTALNHAPANPHNDEYIRVTLNVSGTPSRSRLPPQRGTTLPQLLSPTIMPELQRGEEHQRTTRANTLPSNVHNNETLNNYINNNHHRAGSDQQQVVSRNALAAVSILSLPTSDNEAQFNFEHR